MPLWKEEGITIIAEVGSNHDGDLGKALELIGVAVECGADVVKFQSWLADELISPEHPEYDLLRRLQMPREWLPKLMERCAARGVPFLSTATNERTMDWLEEVDVAGYKLPSGNFTHRPLIDRLIRIGKPIIVSTGAATLDGIVALVDCFEAQGFNEYAFLHCVSRYPARPDQMRLKNIATLHQMLSCPVGLSDHSEGVSLPIAAVALGATIIEKHLTLTGEGLSPDHAFALKPNEFQTMCRGILDACAALYCDFTPDREIMFSMLRSMHLARDKQAGEALKADDIKIIRPNDGLPPSTLQDVIGRRLRRNVAAHAPLKAADLVDDG